ncbi:hypothetical protein BGZ82_001401 [Podila clonocystis]|nr:hypothetical protein BGZ82_001401 [Podila clonocystis]
MILVRLQELWPAYDSKATVVRLDIETNRLTPSKYGVRGLPIAQLFKVDAMVAFEAEALSKSEVKAFLDANI